MKKLFFILITLQLLGCREQHQERSDAPQQAVRTENTARIREQPRDTNQVAVASVTRMVKPVQATSRNDHEPDTLDLRYKHYVFTIAPDGVILQRDTLTGTVRRLTLRVTDLVATLYLAEYEQDYIVYWEETDMEGATSFATRLDPKTNAQKWTASIPAFGLGQPVMEDRYAYVTSIGFVGKLDLENGQYAWKHDELYDQESYAFNSFEEPLVQEKQVVFPGVNGSSRQIDSLIIDKGSGQRLD